jgi:GTP 3',8-cyclase
VKPKIDYMRVSVTDLCNLRCVYCMPPEGVRRVSHAEILRYEEIERLIRVASGIGISRVRITGGEPLVRRGLVGFISRVHGIAGVRDISMTTNAVLLPPRASALRSAGLRRINISLDSLRADSYRRITRVGALGDALAGIESALECGFDGVKLNVVVIRGVNDDEIEDFLAFAKAKGVVLRFIEFMPVSSRSIWGGGEFLSMDEVRACIERSHSLEPTGDVSGAGPAVYYAIDGGPETVGLIAPVSRGFCRSCNRLRLTADGKLRPCLMSEEEIDVKGPLRSGVPDGGIAAVFERAIKGKSFTCDFEKAGGTGRKMVEIGG